MIAVQVRGGAAKLLAAGGGARGAGQSRLDRSAGGENCQRNGQIKEIIETPLELA
jgi:hypothetical protein